MCRSRPPPHHQPTAIQRDLCSQLFSCGVLLVVVTALCFAAPPLRLARNELGLARRRSNGIRDALRQLQSRLHLSQRRLTTRLQDIQLRAIWKVLHETYFLSLLLMAADGAIAICEMLFQTSLVALVGIGDEPTMSPRRLQITNTKVLLRSS